MWSTLLAFLIVFCDRLKYFEEVDSSTEDITCYWPKYISKIKKDDM